MITTTISKNSQLVCCKDRKSTSQTTQKLEQTEKQSKANVLAPRRKPLLTTHCTSIQNVVTYYGA